MSQIQFSGHGGLGGMRQSKLFTNTLKESPKDEQSINAQLLIRGGFIHKEMAGVYSYLTLGLRVLRKIENIIREEMEDIGGQEILMTVLQPKFLWEKTDRWSKGIGDEMYKCKANEEEEIGLGPTHEEMVTNIVRNYISSYRDLPKFVFQIQTKFRKELRSKSGLLREKEFDMKDLYSFHSSEKDLKNYYKKVITSYHKAFKRCGLKAIVVEASGKGFTASTPHEFQVLTEVGEDTIIYCQSSHFAQNKEIAKLKGGDKCPVCGKILKEERSVEVGNIFPLGTKYSKDLEAYFVDKNGEKRPIVMGCYGFGPSRVMGTIVEVHHDKNGILWPKEVAPFDVHLLELGGGGPSKIKKEAEKLYQTLQKNGLDILYDDRDKKTAGEKFADADLIGIPIRIIISERTMEKSSIELKKRKEKEGKLIKISQISNAKF